MYVSAPIERQAKYKVALLWNPTVGCIPGTLIGCWVVGVSFVLGVEKRRRRDKCRLVKISYLSRGKISKTVKYLGNGKIRKKTKKERSACSFKKMGGLYQARKRLGLYPSEPTTILLPLPASRFLDTSCLG